MRLKYKKIAIFYNEHKADALAMSETFAREINKSGARAFLIPCQNHGEWKHNADLVIAVGGDGTVLHAARDLGGLNIPLTAVNSGSLGFLSAIEAAGAVKKLKPLICGKFIPQKRFLLKTTILRGGKRLFPPKTAFNDCVVKSTEPRAIKFAVKFADKFSKNYFGDGLIVSAPAGSTAYALAAGGPIVYPEMKALVVSPICPHTLTHRPLIVPDNWKISVKVMTGERNGHRPPILSVDGQENIDISQRDEVLIWRAKKELIFLFPPGYDYFHTLKEKLQWGERDA